MPKHARTPSSLGSLEISLGAWQEIPRKRDSAIPLLSSLPSKGTFGLRYRRLAVVLAITGAFLFTAMRTSGQAYDKAILQASLSASLPSGLTRNFWSMSSLPGLSTSRSSAEKEADKAWRICPQCSAGGNGVGIVSPHRDTAVPSERRLRSGRATKPEVANFILQDIILASNLEAPKLHVDPRDKSTAFLTPEARSQLFQNYFTSPDSMLSFSFLGLEPSLPTLYMYTRTADHGRLSGETRVKYMQRHVGMLREYEDLVRMNGFGDGTGYRKGIRQLLWIILEDEATLDTGLLQMLKESHLPYLYIAHGPSKRWGKTQWNMALKTVDVLRNKLFADGPVISIDDDALVLPELLRKVWKVKKAIAWQVGNIPLVAEFGQSFWEGPFYEAGKLSRWQYGGYPERKFRLDMNGFAIHSSVIGDGKQISGPQYVPHNNPQGESEFLEQIYGSEAEIEGLCEDTRLEKCYYVWHNHWMPEEIDERHLAPAPADY